MLELFILPTCPYCQKVIEFLDENNIPYKTIDITDTEHEEALIKLGGKRQVPYLIDKMHNVEMYESSDILEYLKTL